MPSASSRTPKKRVASIIHLTDFHLCIEPDGNERSPVEHGQIVRLCVRAARNSGLPGPLRSIVAGLHAHNREAWNKLRVDLPDLVEQRVRDGAVVIVVQSGDVEAYGARLKTPDSAEWFPGFDYLDDELWPELRARGATVIDIFGNHDVWPGTFPSVTGGKRRIVSDALAARPSFSLPMPREIRVPTRRGDIAVYPFNSVATWSVAQTLAHGRPDPYHPGRTEYPESRTGDPFTELRTVASKAKPTLLQIAVVHHPPHLFAQSFFQYFCGGVMHDADLLATACDSLDIRLVLAGHRHALDPVDQLPRGAPPPLQGPLPANVVQLVCESPTAEQGDDTGNAFAVYDLSVDDRSRYLDVERVLYRTFDLQSHFVVDDTKMIIRDLLL